MGSKEFVNKTKEVPVLRQKQKYRGQPSSLKLCRAKGVSRRRLPTSGGPLWRAKEFSSQNEKGPVDFFMLD
jgi:hypothetical protein